MKFIRKTIFLILIIILIFIVIRSSVKRFYPLNHESTVKKYSEIYLLDPYLVFAVIKAESNFNELAESNKGARGLMQITPPTAEWAAKQMGKEDYNVDLLYNPEFNIEMGCWYINELKIEFGDNNKLILAAYNGGRGNVKKWLADKEYSKDGKGLHNIPFGETDKYIKKVGVNYNIYKYLYEKDKNIKALMQEILRIYFKL